MRFLFRVFLILLAIAGAVFALQQYAAESGEVVVLSTVDAQGTPSETRLWVVDHDGHAWLRAGFEGSGWYQRLRAAKQISLQRNGQSARYRAEPDQRAIGAINDAMQAKYGWADSFIGALFGGREDSVAIRLAPPS